MYFIVISSTAIGSLQMKVAAAISMLLSKEWAHCELNLLSGLQCAASVSTLLVSAC